MLPQTCLPDRALKKGLDIVAGRWTRRTRFLEHPHIPLDNNIAEAGIVGLAPGRPPDVGFRSERGISVATTFYTAFYTAFYTVYYSVLESARVGRARPERQRAGRCFLCGSGRKTLSVGTPGTWAGDAIDVRIDRARMHVDGAEHCRVHTSHGQERVTLVEVPRPSSTLLSRREHGLHRRVILFAVEM